MLREHPLTSKYQNHYNQNNPYSSSKYKNIFNIHAYTFPEAFFPYPLFWIGAHEVGGIINAARTLVGRGLRIRADGTRAGNPLPGIIVLELRGEERCGSRPTRRGPIQDVPSRRT